MLIPTVNWNLLSFLLDDSLVEESPEFEIISDETEMNLLSFRAHEDDSLGTNYLSEHGLLIRTLFTYTMSGSDPNKGRR